MEEIQSEAGPAESGPPNSTWWPSDFIENFGSVSLGSEEETLDNKESSRDTKQHGLSSQTASQILWSTGVLSGPIPNGFYSVIPERGLKELHDHIPALDDLNALGAEGLRADIILVDTEKDKKLTMLKQLIMALVRSSSTSAMIKKIVGLVSDFYKRANLEVSPAKAALEESSHLTENRIQMLGQIKHGSCRPRAILFKVLADTVGLESRLVVGLPVDGTVECTDSYKHLSVIVVVNSVEHLVDLTQFPGQLIPRTMKAIFMTRVSAVGEIESADKDSCDSPLEPNNPLNGFLERADPDRYYCFSTKYLPFPFDCLKEMNLWQSWWIVISHDPLCYSADRHEGLQYQQKLEASLNISGPELWNLIIRPGSLEQKQSLSHSEPNITISFGQRSPWKVIDEQQTANSSCRPDGASTLEALRLRRRSMGITPEISDDTARAVRARNESLKRDRILNEHGDDGISYPTRDSNNISVSLNNASYLHRDPHEELFGTWSSLYTPSYQISPQKAISFPFPHDFRTQYSKRSGTSDSVAKEELVSAWNRVLESLFYNNRPLLPFQEWNIDFSELTVGTRVGIGFSGEVFRGFWNGTKVAIKVFLEQDLTAENMEDFCNEISILSRLRHPNVILFLGACTKPPGLSMVTEYMEMGSLYYLIHLSGQKKKLSWRRRLKMLHDICRGLMCIHRMKVVHRDLKTANCLVNKHWTVKICDFGLSRMMADVSTRDSSSAGTPEWMAPELIRNEPFTEKCDIFSFGVIMWELCTLHRPWAGIPPERVVYAVAHEGSRLELPEGPLSRLIADCWALPTERPSCEEILLRLPDCGFTPC